jgi:transposase-like protein|tara:strand:+ start:354 stop:656 length:303 start_codon:yes stop_codon:yes gene_type:complete
MMPKQKITCKNCSSTSIVKRGFAKNKLQNLQKYQCKGCSRIFTLEQTKGKTYPTKIILQAISTYNLGYSLEQTAENINKKHSSTISAKTINNWINELPSP